MDRDFVPVSFHSPLETSFVLIFKMADVGSLLLVLELVEDFKEMNDIMDDDDDIVVFSAVSCFMRRNLTRISGYFEQTVLRYLPDEFRQHFCMTRETCEILTREIVQTGCIPLGNAFGRPVIAPEKQVFRRVVQATVDLCGQYIRWPLGE